jgi:cellulose biosynthesis protein BcsQ
MEDSVHFAEYSENIQNAAKPGYAEANTHERQVSESRQVMPDEHTRESSGRRYTYVIAIASQKGGVAKTTTVVSLGGALVKRNKEILVVDMDAQANLTLALGNDPSRMRNAITEVMFNSATMISVSRESSIPGLDLIPSNSGMEMAERFLPMRKDYEIILHRAIDTELRSVEFGRSMHKQIGRNSDQPNFAYQASEIGQTSVTESLASANTRSTPANSRPTLATSSAPAIHYDFVILDCPPFLGAVMLNALIASDMLIIPTQPEYFSAHALRTMMSTIRQVRSKYNPNLIYRILITMFDGRNRIHREVCDQIRNTFGEGVFETIIGVDTKLRESAIEGLPITHHRSHSRGALQYDALAQEIMQYVR